MIQETLSGDEWTLVSRLRDIPDGSARDELVALLKDLFAFVADPHCTQAQADGVPCRSVAIDCETCREVVRALTTLHECVRMA